jgi:hypothetical protein
MGGRPQSGKVGHAMDSLSASPGIIINSGLVKEIMAEKAS